jgi:hypothetical protein
MNYAPVPTVNVHVAVRAVLKMFVAVMTTSLFPVPAGTYTVPIELTVTPAVSLAQVHFDGGLLVPAASM